MPIGHAITFEDELMVVDYYKNNPITISQAANDLGFSSPTVIKILDKYRIDRHKRSKLFSPNLNESYFENIDTEEKAYYLGFIITDGNVFEPSSNSQSSVSITQSEGDKYILEQFLKEVGSNRVVASDGRGCCQASVVSDKMAKDLGRYGVVPNKTLISFLPILNREELMRHLVRGIFDGDGNIKAYQTNIRNRYAHAFSFSGSHQLMLDLGEYVSGKLSIRKPKVYDYRDRHLSEIKWQAKDDMYLLGEWMYQESNIFLRRKYDKYIDFKTHYCFE